MATETLLVVDDEADLLSGLKRLLAPQFGCRVMTAQSARDALALVETEAVDHKMKRLKMVA